MTEFNRGRQAALAGSQATSVTRAESQSARASGAVDSAGSSVPIVKQSPKTLQIAAEHMIDPGLGLHPLEWADAKTKFRWSGAWPFVKFIERLDRSTPCQVSFVIMAFAHGLSARDLKCFIDEAPAELKVGEEYGFIVAKTSAPRTATNSIELRLETPLVDEAGGLNRKIGFTLVSIHIAR
jgi:hypothetical protein